MIIRYMQGSEFVHTITPISFTTSKSDAVTHDLNFDCCSEDEVHNSIVQTIEKLYSQTGNLNWSVQVYRSDDSMCIGHLETVDVDETVRTVLSSTATVEEGRYLKFLASVVAEYMPDVKIKASFSAKLAATASAPIVKGAAKEDDEAIKKLIEEISSKTKADISKPTETLDDYMCNETLREELEEIKDFFENESVYRDAGIVTPKGILFKGVPGTGKTYAARCLAGSTECYFMSCTASALQGQYIGSGAENIRAIFKGAKTLREKSGKGVYLFIDEIDSFGNREHRSGGAGGEEDRTLNQLLAEMSGFVDSEGVMVLGATNFSDRLDDALTRSGRFSRQITIEKPDFAERESMVNYYLNKIKYPLDDTTCDEIASITKGLTPADIKEIINEAAILTVRQKLSNITLNNVNEAVNKVITKNIRRPDGKLDTHLVAAHEAGHVLAEVMYADSVPVKVTNYSYGSAGGFTQSGSHLEGICDKDRHIAEIKMLLGGRAAEEAMFGKITNGASNDLERAKAHLKHYFSTYHFEQYDVKELEQTVLDRLHDIYTEVVEDFKTKYYKDILTNLTDSLVCQRVLYSKDIAAICSTLLLKGDIL